MFDALRILEMLSELISPPPEPTLEIMAVMSLPLQSLANSVGQYASVSMFDALRILEMLSELISRPSSLRMSAAYTHASSLLDPPRDMINLWTESQSCSS